MDAYGGSSAVDSFNIIKGSYIQQILENKNCEYRHSHEHPTAAELQLMADKFENEMKDLTPLFAKELHCFDGEHFVVDSTSYLLLLVDEDYMVKICVHCYKDFFFVDRQSIMMCCRKFLLLRYTPSHRKINKTEKHAFDIKNVLLQSPDELLFYDFAYEIHSQEFLYQKNNEIYALFGKKKEPCLLDDIQRKYKVRAINNDFISFWNALLQDCATPYVR